MRRAQARDGSSALFYDVEMHLPWKGVLVKSEDGTKPMEPEGSTPGQLANYQAIWERERVTRVEGMLSVSNVTHWTERAEWTHQVAEEQQEMPRLPGGGEAPQFYRIDTPASRARMKEEERTDPKRLILDKHSEVLADKIKGALERALRAVRKKVGCK